MPNAFKRVSAATATGFSRVWPARRGVSTRVEGVCDSSNYDAIDGKVEGVLLSTGGQVLFPLGGDVATLEGSPEAVFKGAAVIEIIDFDGRRKLLPRARDKDDAAGAAAEDGHGKKLKWAEAQAIVLSAAFHAVRFVGE